MLRVIISFVVLLSLDFLWISVLAKGAYVRSYAHVLRLENEQIIPIWWAVGLVYLALVGGLNYFALSWVEQSMRVALIHAIAFGVVVYAVYDFTCLALFKDWPVLMSIVDCFWGGFLCGATALITLRLEAWLLKLF
jgi:uncharacterized membrane protein